MIRSAFMDRDECMPILQQDLRIWMWRGLVAAAGSMFVLVVAAILCGLLTLLGDESGAQIASGVALAAAVGWLAVLSALVLLLTWERSTNGDTRSATTIEGTAKNGMNGVYDEPRAA